MLDIFFDYVGRGIDWAADHSAAFFRIASTWPLWTKLVAVGVMAVIVTSRLVNGIDPPKTNKRRM